jgi:hypothetical protein
MRIDFIKYDEVQNIYTIRYEIEAKKGVLRRTTATFSNGVLSRDTNNKKLVSLIKEHITALKSIKK